MAVYTSRSYTLDTLPKILKDYRWPQLFWVEDFIDQHVKNRWVPISPPRSPSNYDRMTEHYLDCIVNNREPLVSGEDGARAIEVMCATLTSMETGGWVDLPLTAEVIPPNYEPLAKEG
jgi:predicted dehydrogenase